MKKAIYLFILFISLFCMTSNVYATDYSTIICGMKYWSPYNDCSSSSDNASKYRAVLSIDYKEDGTIVLNKVLDEAFNTDGDNPDYNEVQGITADSKANVYYAYNENFKYVYDFTALAKYYKQSNIIPQEIVASYYTPTGSAVSFETGNARYFYFGASEVDIIKNKQTTEYFFARDENDDLKNISSSCVDLTIYKNKLEADIAKYGSTDEDVKIQAENLTEMCDNYLAYNKETSNACYNDCKNLKSDIHKMGIDVFNETNSCGLGSKMVAWLIRVLKLLRFIVPTLVILLSTYEYVSAMMAAADDAFKKVGGRFGKRLFIMILFFVLPSLLQFIFNVFNVDGLNSSNPYCLK